MCPQLTIHDIWYTHICDSRSISPMLLSLHWKCICCCFFEKLRKYLYLYKNNNYKLYTSGSDHTVPDQIGFVCHKDAGLSFYLRPDVMKNPINGCSSCHFSDLWLANTFTVLDRKCKKKTDREKINSLIRQFPFKYTVYSEI